MQSVRDFTANIDMHVVVLAVAAATKLDIRELWVAFGTERISDTYKFTRLLHLLGPANLKLCILYEQFYLRLPIRQEKFCAVVV